MRLLGLAVVLAACTSNRTAMRWALYQETTAAQCVLDRSDIPNRLETERHRRREGRLPWFGRRLPLEFNDRQRYVCPWEQPHFDCEPDHRRTEVHERAALDVFAGVSGTLEADHIEGELFGHVECTGDHCDAAADALGIELPCTFSHPFYGEPRLVLWEDL